MGHERRRGDDHQVGRDRLVDCPGAPLPSAEEEGEPTLRSVRDDPSSRRRIDDELDRRLVRRMIDGREPMPRPVGPVVPERLPPPGAVGRDDQPVAGRAAVVHHDADGVARGARGRERNAHHAAIVLGDHAARPRAPDLHLGHPHRGEEVEREHPDRLPPRDGERRPDRDLRTAPRQVDGEAIPQDVDAGHLRRERVGRPTAGDREEGGARGDDAPRRSHSAACRSARANSGAVV